MRAYMNEEIFRIDAILKQKTRITINTFNSIHWKKYSSHVYFENCPPSILITC